MSDDFPLIKDLYSFHGNYKKEREIGIEIEMEGRNLNIPDNKLWGVKNDGSLRGPEHCEYVLNGPVALNKVMDALTILQGLFRENIVLTPSDRCGIHIHINVQHFTFQETFNFILLYLLLEKVLVGYCGESREGNLYCLRGCDAEYFIDMMIETKKHSDLHHLASGRDTLRYASVNPTAIFKFGSVEFRSLRTPQNLDAIVEWVNLLHTVKTSSLQFDEPTEIIDRYSARGNDRFLSDMVGLRFSELLQKQVEDVEQKILEGIRLTQDIAYTPTITYPLTKADIGMGKKKSQKTRDGRYTITSMPNWDVTVRPDTINTAPEMPEPNEMPEPERPRRRRRGKRIVEGRDGRPYRLRENEELQFTDENHPYAHNLDTGRIRALSWRR